MNAESDALLIIIFGTHVILFAVAIPSVVCRLSVTFVHPTQPIEIFGNVCTPSADVHANFFGDCIRGTPSVGG